MGKSSISMGHFPWRTVSHNQRVVDGNPRPIKIGWFLSKERRENWHPVPMGGHFISVRNS